MSRPAIQFTDNDIRQIEELAGLGLTLPKIAAVMGFSEQLLRQRRTTEKKINSALERGRAVAEQNVGKSLYERAIAGDVAAIRWWEMTRAHRSATLAVEQTSNVTVSGGVTIYIPDNGR